MTLLSPVPSGTLSVCLRVYPCSAMIRIASGMCARAALRVLSRTCTTTVGIAASTWLLICARNSFSQDFPDWLNRPMRLSLAISIVHKEEVLTDSDFSHP